MLGTFAEVYNPERVESLSFGGIPVTNLDLCFLPTNPEATTISAALVADFLTTCYKVLPSKPEAWDQMIADLRRRETVAVRPL